MGLIAYLVELIVALAKVFIAVEQQKEGVAKAEAIGAVHEAETKLEKDDLTEQELKDEATILAAGSRTLIGE